MRFRFALAPALGLTAIAALAAACLASAPHGIRRETDDDGGAGGSDLIVGDDAGIPDAKDELPVTDPHAVLGVSPPHGSFEGGQRATVVGNGFASTVRVWFGDAEVDPAAIVPIDPQHVQVDVPPGAPGVVEVTAQNGDDASTKRSLPGAYTYDAVYAAPSSGPVSGGNVVEILGKGTSFDATTTVKIDQKPCAALTVDSATSIACTVPKGTPGTKSITVTTGADSIVVLDAYTYEDSANGYKGGLGGAPLAGQLKVLAYDNYTGDPIAGAYAIAGTDDTALVAQTDASGVALFSDPSLDAPRTVTVAGKCRSPITFVDVPVDTVTVYLDPVLSPACGSSGDPPPVGGKPSNGGAIVGELVWPQTAEFKKGKWQNVPSPVGPNEKKAAYVFLTQGDPTAPFQLPSSSSALGEDTPGDVGYGFALGAPAGNRAIYALAGIQNDAVSPPKFTAYAMGVAKGIAVTPGGQTGKVYVSMSHTLDGALTMNVAAPAPGPKGPDRLYATVAVMLGNDGYAILPAAQKAPLLPVSGALSFVGLPWLGADLLGATYSSTARAATGPSLTAPLSVVGRLLTTSTATPVDVTGFVGVPTLTTPAVNTKWDARHLATSFPAMGAPIDVTVYAITSGNGLVTWTVAVPGGSNAVELPDLSPYEQAGLPAGPLTIGVYGGRVASFDYANVRYRDLRPQGMTAYALDYFPAHL